METLTDEEKIEYLEEELKDIFTSDQLDIIECVIWNLLGLTPKGTEQEKAELRYALEMFYIESFARDPEVMYAEMISDEL